MRDDPIKIPIFNSLEEEKIEIKKSTKKNSVPLFPFFFFFFWVKPAALTFLYCNDPALLKKIVIRLACIM